ncbi:mucin-6-like [Cydia fagiglandana]|uniref:mucin-6-like n=1 Tax=Cydia fagiglandana TaxID=1458189 RepID=UPI002FEE3F7A
MKFPTLAAPTASPLVSHTTPTAADGCSADEVPDACSAHCEPTCESHDTNRFCTANCLPGCKCREGLLRRKDRQCVLLEQCSDGCSADEVPDACSAHCEPTCESHDTNRFCTANCLPGCKCREGLLRRKDRQCVLLEQCSADGCSSDEVPDACSAHCEPTCESHDANRFCTANCLPGCKCREGLLRRKDRQCVPLEQWSDGCSSDEVPDACSAHCEPTCESHDANRFCTANCLPGCKCREGLLRRKDRQCVPLEQCCKFAVAVRP